VRGLGCRVALQGGGAPALRAAVPLDVRGRGPGQDRWITPHLRPRRARCRDARPAPELTKKERGRARRRTRPLLVLGDTVRTSCPVRTSFPVTTSLPAPNDADAVIPSRGLGRISSCTDQRHRWCGRTLVDLRHPPTFLIGERGRGLSWVSPPPASALALANLAPAVLPRAAALLHPFECHRHPSVGFRCPSGFYRKTAAVLRRPSTGSARPLSWGFAPSSGRERKGSG
jgi:hypothetical protein